MDTARKQANMVTNLAQICFTNKQLLLLWKLVLL